MKIGFVIDDGIDSTDGVQQYVKTLGNWLTKNGHDVIYITSTGQHKTLKVLNVAKNITVAFNRNVLRIPLAASAKKLHEILVTENFDVIHVQMPYSPLLSGRLIHVLPKNVALVGTFHIAPFGPTQENMSKILAYIVKPQLPRFNGIVSVSDAAQSYAKRAFGINSIVLPNAVNTVGYDRTKIKKPQSLIFVGRLVYRKGCLQLLGAINYLVKSLGYTIFTLNIVGDGPERGAIERYISEHNLTKYVQLSGKVTETKKIQLLQNARIAVYPSISGESFGIVLIEAMAAGCAVLGGSNDGYSFVLKQTPEALFDPLDHQKLAFMLKRLLSNDNVMQRLIRQQQNILKNFSIDSVGEDIIKQYACAIEKNAHSGHNSS